MNAPAIVSGDGSAPSVRAGALTSNTHLEERCRQGRLVVEIQVEVVRAHADDPRIEDEVRIGLLRVTR